MKKFLARHRRIKIYIFLIIIIVWLICMAIQTKGIRLRSYESKSYPGQAFGTSIKKTLYMDDEAERDEVDKAIDALLNSLDERLSYRNSESELAICNRSYVLDGIVELSSDILGYIKREMEICKETEGAFSPCILPLSKLWGIEDGASDIPSQDEIDKVLSHIDPSDIKIVDDGISFHSYDMELDLGAVGKGIAADEVMKLLDEKKVPGAIISIGGTIAVYGDKGKDDKWYVGIQDPRDKEGNVFGVLEVSGGSVVSTSGDYEKYFEADGKRYHHIFDPKTGYPADNGLISVTICSDDGFLSDAMSTACFVMGLDEGMKYAKKKGVDAIFVTSDKKVYVTKSVKKRFVLKADEYEIAKR